MSKTKGSLLLVGAAIALTACSGAGEPELAIMGEAPAKLPAWISGSAEMPVNDLTHVADVGHLKVFASRDDQDDWCVVLAIEPTSKGSDWAAAASCAPSARVAADGVSVRAVASSTRGGEARLLPDDSSGEIGKGSERVGDNLAVRR
ncbi:MAG: hypothetical protein L0H25_06185 [Micrococcales bacterium]|nr:hypothetical protein [Micrococcales bacterium]